jgi:hypothetical protein
VTLKTTGKEPSHFVRLSSRMSLSDVAIFVDLHNNLHNKDSTFLVSFAFVCIELTNSYCIETVNKQVFQRIFKKMEEN